MALVTQRIWTTGRRKHCAWGFTAQRDGKQARRFREDWTKEDAERALSEWTLGIQPAPANGGGVPTNNGMTLGEMLDKFLEARSKSKRNKSVQDDRERTGPLLAFFGKATPVSAITTARVADYRLNRAGTKSRIGKLLSSTTINRECQVLRGAFNLAFEREEIDKIPKFKMESEHERERWLTVVEIEALVTACRTSKNPRLTGLVLVGVHTGLRLSELIGLQWQEVDLTRGVITLEASRTKSGKSRVVPLNADAYAILAPMRSDAGGLGAAGRVWKELHDFDTAFRAAVRRAGLETNDPTRRVTFHTLRHTFASLFAQRTGDLLRLQKIMGHASYKTTEKTYTKFTPDYVVGATAALEGLGAGKINAQSTHEAVAATLTPARVS